MRLEAPQDREHGIADFLLLLAAVCLALATWLSFPDPSSVPLWKSCVSVLMTGLFVLAALTRNLRWAVIFRGLTGGWLIAAPFVLDFADIATARWSYLAIGLLFATLAISCDFGNFRHFRAAERSNPDRRAI